MGSEYLPLLRALFWTLSLATATLPPRLAVVAYLLVAHIDLSGPVWQATTSLGFENTVKIVVLPTILLLRTRVSLRVLSQKVASTLPGRLWLLFCAYAALSVLWSSYQFSGLKFLGYLYGYTVLVVAALVYWKKQYLSANSLLIAVWGSFALAVWQTYFTNLPFGGTVVRRFTSFTSPQSFGFFLVGTAVLLLLISKRGRATPKHLLILMTHVAIIIALILSGSRYSFLGYLFAIATVFGIRLLLAKRQLLLLQRLITSASLVILVIFGLFVSLNLLPAQRINQLVAAAKGEISPQDIGTVAWRIGLYATALDELRLRRPVGLLVGSGTSSGGTIATRHSEGQTWLSIDPNRTFHNEFIRTFYEWGVIGAVLFIGLLTSLAVATIRLLRQGFHEGLALLAITPVGFFGLLIENMLARTGTPSGLAIALIIGYAGHRRFFGRYVVDTSRQIMP